MCPVWGHQITPQIGKTEPTPKKTIRIERRPTASFLALSESPAPKWAVNRHKLPTTGPKNWPMEAPDGPPVARRRVPPIATAISGPLTAQSPTRRNAASWGPQRATRALPCAPRGAERGLQWPILGGKAGCAWVLPWSTPLCSVPCAGVTMSSSSSCCCCCCCSLPRRPPLCGERCGSVGGGGGGGGDHGGDRGGGGGGGGEWIVGGVAHSSVGVLCMELCSLSCSLSLVPLVVSLLVVIAVSRRSPHWPSESE